MMFSLCFQAAVRSASGRSTDDEAFVLSRELPNSPAPFPGPQASVIFDMIRTSWYFNVSLSGRRGPVAARAIEFHPAYRSPPVVRRRGVI
jgi:hypothetical protein